MHKHFDLDISIFETSNALACVIDEDFKITFISKKWKKLLNGYGEPYSFLHLFNEQNRKHVLNTLTTCKQTGITEAFVATLINCAEPLWLECDCFPIKSKNGDSLLVLARNASDQINLEQENAKLASLISSAEDVSLIGHWQLDVKTKAVFWSDEIYKIHGVDRQEYSPKLESAIGFYHPDDVSKVQGYVNNAVHKGKGWYFELRLVRPNGEVRHVISQGNVHLDTHSKPDFVYGIFQDITEQKKLLCERDILAFAVENTSVGIIVSDSERNVISINRGFEQLSGFTLDEVKGKNISQFVQGDETDINTIQQIRDALDSETNVDVEILNYHKDGHTYWNHLVISPVYRDGKLSEYIGIQQNVTEEFKAKQKLKEINIDLEALVAERTKALEVSLEKLQQQSDTDPLTGVFNRRSFSEKITSELKRSTRNRHPLSLAMIDVDHFKTVNDRYGHSAGDLVLQSLVQMLNSEMRETDSLFRMGGEEFLLMMPETGKTQSAIVAERIRKNVEATKIALDDSLVSITISIGVISISEAISVRDCMLQVDDKLYEAKRQGRNLVVI